MTTSITRPTRPLEWHPPRAAISAVPYLPGLDGMRAIAVAVVMVYHANSAWLPGGFLGVEVFFVISGYLITLLLIGEHERSGSVSLSNFYMRRARRLLPALFTLLILVTLYTTLFRRDALGQLRGDVIAALTYTTNWYQIWVGQGYTATGDFAPLRHLWSLAVEEQFYLLWPLVMVGLIRLGRRRLPDISRYLFLAASGGDGADGVAVLPGSDRDVRHHAGCVLAGRRPLHLEDGHAVPEHAHPIRWPAARRRVRDGVAAGRHHAQPDADQGALTRRAGAHRSGRVRRRCAGTSTSSSRRVPIRGCSAAGSSSAGSPRLMIIAAVTHQRSLAGPLLGQRRAPVDRHPVVWPVPLPLADLPDDATGGRQTAERAAVPHRHGGRLCRDRAVVPVHRDADPQGPRRPLVAQTQGGA